MPNPPTRSDATLPIAEVVLLRGYDRVLHYSIPVPLRDRIAPGLRVLAPFRSDWRAGIVTRRLKSSGFTPLKPLVAALDEAPLLDRPMMALARWLSEYYVSGWGPAIRAVLPSGLDLKAGRNCRITPKGLEALSSAEPGTPRDLPILEALRKAETGLRPAMLKRRLQKSDGLPRGWEARLAALVKRGLIEESPVLPRARPPRTPEAAGPPGGEWISGPRSPAGGLPAEASSTKAAAELAAAARAGGFSVLHLEGDPRRARPAVLAAIRSTVETGRAAIVLSPEIHHLPEWIDLTKRAGLGPAAVLHGGLSDRERQNAWERIRRGEVPVVIGTRMAALAPVRRLGLIVVEEEADEAYKQEESPRYHARDLAVLRASHSGALTVLTAAAPSVETYANTRNGKYRSIRLTEGPPMRGPEVRLVDLSRLPPRTLLSDEMLGAVETRLKNREPSVLILNRRGYGTALFCRDCGWVARCRRCEVALVYSRERRMARCRYCGLATDPPAVCGQCRGTKMQVIGHGTEQAEELLRRRFPDARMARLDRETAGPDEADDVMRRLSAGDLDLVLGTQMLLKTSALSRPVLVALLQADQAFHRPDFRAGEKTFQLTARVRTLAGGGEVWIQTHYPAHHSLAWAVSGRMEEFFGPELAQRKAMSYPPFVRLAAVIVKALRESEADAAARRFSEALRAAVPEGQRANLTVLGPAPAPHPRLREKFRRQILVKAASPGLLQRALSSALEGVRSGGRGPRVWYELDVDPARMA